MSSKQYMMSCINGNTFEVTKSRGNGHVCRLENGEPVSGGSKTPIGLRRRKDWFSVVPGCFELLQNPLMPGKTKTRGESGKTWIPAQRSSNTG